MSNGVRRECGALTVCRVRATKFVYMLRCVERDGSVGVRETLPGEEIALLTTSVGSGP